MVESEAPIIRLIFAWIGLERMSLRAVCRRLQQMGCQTRRGSTYWHASTIRDMLNNPAYIGRAAFGRARFLPPRPRLRPIRGHLKPSPRAASRIPMPREEWMEIPVPPIIVPRCSRLCEHSLRRTGGVSGNVSAASAGCCKV